METENQQAVLEASYEKSSDPPKELKMWQAIKMFKASSRQTKYFIFTLMLYMLALIWTTLQAYARLEYSRSDTTKPILIERNTYDNP